MSSQGRKGLGSSFATSSSLPCVQTATSQSGLQHGLSATQSAPSIVGRHASPKEPSPQAFPTLFQRAPEIGPNVETPKKNRQSKFGAASRGFKKFLHAKKKKTPLKKTLEDVFLSNLPVFRSKLVSFWSLFALWNEVVNSETRFDPHRFQDHLRPTSQFDCFELTCESFDPNAADQRQRFQQANTLLLHGYSKRIPEHTRPRVRAASADHTLPCPQDATCWHRVHYDRSDFYFWEYLPMHISLQRTPLTKYYLESDEEVLWNFGRKIALLTFHPEHSLIEDQLAKELRSKSLRCPRLQNLYFVQSVPEACVLLWTAVGLKKARRGKLNVFPDLLCQPQPSSPFIKYLKRVVIDREDLDSGFLSLKTDVMDRVAWAALFLFLKTDDSKFPPKLADNEAWLYLGYPTEIIRDYHRNQMREYLDNESFRAHFPTCYQLLSRAHARHGINEPVPQPPFVSLDTAGSAAMSSLILKPSSSMASPSSSPASSSSSPSSSMFSSPFSSPSSSPSLSPELSTTSSPSALSLSVRQSFPFLFDAATANLLMMGESLRDVQAKEHDMVDDAPLDKQTVATLLALRPDIGMALISRLGDFSPADQLWLLEVILTQTPIYFLPISSSTILLDLVKRERPSDTLITLLNRIRQFPLLMRPLAEWLHSYYAQNPDQIPEGNSESARRLQNIFAQHSFPSAGSSALKILENNPARDHTDVVRQLRQRTHLTYVEMRFLITCLHRGIRIKGVAANLADLSRLHPIALHLQLLMASDRLTAFRQMSFASLASLARFMRCYPKFQISTLEDQNAVSALYQLNEAVMDQLNDLLDWELANFATSPEQEKVLCDVASAIPFFTDIWSNVLDPLADKLYLFITYFPLRASSVKVLIRALGSILRFANQPRHVKILDFLLSLLNTFQYRTAVIEALDAMSSTALIERSYLCRVFNPLSNCNLVDIQDRLSACLLQARNEWPDTPAAMEITSIFFHVLTTDLSICDTLLEMMGEAVHFLDATYAEYLIAKHFTKLCSTTTEEQFQCLTFLTANPALRIQVWVIMYLLERMPACASDSPYLKFYQVRTLERSQDEPRADEDTFLRLEWYSRTWFEQLLQLFPNRTDLCAFVQAKLEKPVQVQQRPHLYSHPKLARLFHLFYPFSFPDLQHRITNNKLCSSTFVGAHRVPQLFYFSQSLEQSNLGCCSACNRECNPPHQVHRWCQPHAFCDCTRRGNAHFDFFFNSAALPSFAPPPPSLNTGARALQVDDALSIAWACGPLDGGYDSRGGWPVANIEPFPHISTPDTSPVRFLFGNEPRFCRTKLEFMRFLRDLPPKTTVVHFFGFGKNIEDSGEVLIFEDEHVTAAELVEVLKNQKPRLIILQTCWSLEICRTLAHKQVCSVSIGGPGFSHPGIPAFPLFQRFFPRFYVKLFQGKTVGESLDKAQMEQNAELAFVGIVHIFVRDNPGSCSDLLDVYARHAPLIFDNGNYEGYSNFDLAGDRNVFFSCLQASSAT